MPAESFLIVAVAIFLLAAAACLFALAILIATIIRDEIRED